MSQTEDNGKVDNPANFNKVLFQARLCDDKKRSALGAGKMCHIPLLWHYSLYLIATREWPRKLQLKIAM